MKQNGKHMLESGTSGMPDAEAEKGSAGGRINIARRAIADRSVASGAGRVQGRTPETGALRTLDQWFVFLYILTVFFT